MSDLLPLLIGLVAGLVLAGAPFSARVRGLRTDLRHRDAALTAAREDILTLREELEASRSRPAQHSAEILADNADLRRRMDELADALMTQAGSGAPRSERPAASVAPTDPAL